MKLIVASGNKGKIKEIKQLLPQFDIVAFEDILGKIDIVEDGNSFQQNSIIKAKTIAKHLQHQNYQDDFLILSDDSGISIKELNNEPNIYSARYASIGATDQENNQKVIKKLQEKNLTTSRAYYTACITIWYKNQIFTTHGWMHGVVSIYPKGNNGFGYDPLFTPDGFDKTLGELSNDIKSKISHRSKALELAKLQIKVLTK
jgi:XTP/dITP diphosphohydrolase